MNNEQTDNQPDWNKEDYVKEAIHKLVNYVEREAYREGYDKGLEDGYKGREKDMEASNMSDPAEF